MKSIYLNHYRQRIKKFKIAVTFLTGYNGIFNVRNDNNKFCFKKSLFDEDFIQIRIPKKAYALESLKDENKRIIIDEDHFTESHYPFHIQPNFSTQGSIIEIKPQGLLIGFVFNDSIGNLLGFDETVLYEEHKIYQKNLSIFYHLIIF